MSFLIVRVQPGPTGYAIFDDEDEAYLEDGLTLRLAADLIGVERFQGAGGHKIIQSGEGGGKGGVWRKVQARAFEEGWSRRRA